MNAFDEICRICPKDKPAAGEEIRRLLCGDFTYVPNDIRFTKENVNLIQKLFASQMKGCIDEAFYADGDTIVRMDGWEAHKRGLSMEERMAEADKILKMAEGNDGPANLIARLVSSAERRTVEVKMMGLNEPEPFVLTSAPTGCDARLAVLVAEALMETAGLRPARGMRERRNS